MVSTDATVQAGTYEMEYELCDLSTPANCEVAMVTIVVEGNERTAKQMAAFYNSTPASIKARISEIRTQKGVAVYANKHTDSNGRTVTKYRAGTPRKAVVAAGYRALAAGLV